MGVLAAGCAPRPDGQQPPPDPVRTAVDGLPEADRAFAAASSITDVVSGLTPMFAADVVVPLPDGRFAMGREEAVEALRANPDNAGSRLEWAPLRGGSPRMACTGSRSAT
ncbi:MAG: hypothetical protein Q8N53_02910 [Longimicrobiales bacterium]|nr:hypothetical protein [Longimicrobiales bacterium]